MAIIASVTESLLTSTNTTTIVNVAASAQPYELLVIYRIVGTPTIVTTEATWTDAAGGQSVTVTGSYPVGVHSLRPIIIEADDSRITLISTASVASQVYVSTTLKSLA